MNRVLLVTNIPTPYRLPLFNAIDRGLRSHGSSLHVLFAAEREDSRRWTIDLGAARFTYELSGGKSLQIPGRNFPTFVHRGLVRRIRELDPELVIVGGFGPSAFKVWLNSLLDSRPYAIWSGAIGHDGFYPWIRIPQRRLLLSRAAGCIAYGTAAKRYLMSLGQPEQRIRVAFNTIDTEYFIPVERQAGRGPFTFVSIGELVDQKRTGLTLQAAGRLAAMRRDFRLLIVGAGPERERLEVQARDLGLQGIVEFRGFLDKNEVRSALVESDCLLFSSESDVWGLVVNEAMAMTVPAISSNQCGVTHDLVLDNQTGFALDFADTELVAERMGWLLEHREEACAMGKRARRHLLEKASLSATATAWVNAIREFKRTPEHRQFQ